MTSRPKARVGSTTSVRFADLAKACPVRQVLEAISKLKGQRDEH